MGAAQTLLESGASPKREERTNLCGPRETYRRAGTCEADMSNQSKLRKWAAEAARQAKAEKDANEARRLASFARYWRRLADTEDWQRDNEAA